MFPGEFEYFSPQSVDEALGLLARFGEDAKILAGGQSLIPMMKLRIASPQYLIDVNRIASLKGIARSGKQVIFGALCRHADVLESALIQEHLPLMTDAASSTADVQVRNRGTLGGSLAHADPAGDWPAALLALDAEVAIAGRDGSRTLPLRDFIVDAYTTQVAPDEIVTKIAVPLPELPAGGAYVKFERRAGDFAVASVGVQLELDPDDRLHHVAVSLGALGAVPARASGAEALLRGQPVARAPIDEAALLVERQTQPFADTRGSVDYKRHLAGVLFRRAFAMAVDRAHGREVRPLLL